MAVENEVYIFQNVSLDSLSPIAQKTYDLYDPYWGYLKAGWEKDCFARPFGRDTIMSANHKSKAHEINPKIRLDQVFPAIAYLLLHIPEKDIPEANIYKGRIPHEMGTREQGFPKNFGYVDEIGFGICCDSADVSDRTLLTIFELEEKFPTRLQIAINTLAKKLNKPAFSINHYVEMITEWAVANTNEFEGSAFIGAIYDPKRDNIKHKGLNKQCWRDSEYSMTKADGSELIHPIYPAEEQALRWSALKLAGNRLAKSNPDLAYKALIAAELTKQRFNQKFIYKDGDGSYIASAVDKEDYQVRDVTCDEITLLSHHIGEENFISDPILRRNIILRSYQKLFTKLGGFRTIDRLNHPKNIYHGPTSIWPHRQADIVYAIDFEAERVKNENPLWHEEYRKKAREVACAALGPIGYYEDPIELVLLTEKGYDLFRTYCEELDRYQESSRVQAFSGFAALYLIEYLKAKHNVKEIPVLQKIALFDRTESIA